MSNKTAILFLTHIITKDILREFEKIVNESDGIGDVFFVYDDSVIGVPDEIKIYEYWSFNYDKIKDLGYPITNDEKRIALVPWTKAFLHGNYQISVINFFLENQKYDYYWYIEYDSRFSGRWGHLFERFNNDSDLTVSFIRTYDEQPGWPFWYLSHPTLSIQETKRLRSFNPFMRISRKALLDLHNSLLDGWIGYIEMLIPTLLYNHGFKLEDFGGSGKFCKEENRNKYYKDDKNSIIGLLDRGTMRYEPPHILYFGIKKNKLYHPVKPVKDRLGYYFKKAKRFIKNFQNS